MKPAPAPQSSLVVELRSGFDAGFAVPPPGRESAESVLLIRTGGERFAVRPGHIGGLSRIRKIVPLPTRLPELLGLTALRGAILPVFDLAVLLGIPRDATPPEWLILAAADTDVGLAFHAFEGQDAPEWLGEDGDWRGKAVRLVRTGPVIRAVLDIPGLVASIRARAGVSHAIKEQRQ